MKRIVFLSFLFFAITNYCIAENVPVAKAKTVALNFLHSSLVRSSTDIRDLNLLSTDSIFNINGEKIAAYYVFENQNKNGFIIVSADDIVQPILGYSTESTVDTDNLPPAYKKWMENYKMQIEFAIQNKLNATEKIKTEWDNFYNNTIPINKNPLAVSPLCSTKWDQQPYVNAMCPYDAANTTNQHCVTGCPATAMAQIMKYWNYPTQGSGIHSYNHPTYGTLSANFGATTYNWSSMPNIVSSPNTAVATLMYHCGVAVNMQYGANLSGGFVIINSPTPTANCEYAYKTYFGYNPTTIQGLKRVNYTDANWKNLLKSDLNASQPIQYAGFGTNGGHTFVCDGYDVSDYFHMNWGWGGSSDGYFTIDALNPGSLGTGGGAGGFNSGQQAVVGIHPLTTTPVGTGLKLYSAITITPNPISFYGAFSVNVDIANTSTSTFNGDFTAALFNSNYEFVDFIETLTGKTLPTNTHFTNGLTFSTTGILTVPGNYYVGIFYKESNGNWNIVANGSYSNLKPVTISGPVDYIKLNSPITPTPTTFVQGQPASVNVNILNDGTSTYYGTYTVSLYDLTGNFVQTIGTYTESSGLQAGYTYSSPYLTFSSPAITASPGTYLLTVWEHEVGYSDYLAGGDLYTNPVYIDVVAPVIQPDIYESNNTTASSYTLPLTFNGNTAVIKTTGSNLHVTTDEDYYKINLAANYNYQITARVQDSYNNNDGNTYTADVLWTYDTGSGFSNAIDDIMTGTINVNSSGSIIFHVAPYLSGLKGTYRLDISVSRVSTSDINEPEKDKTLIYPNPVKDYLFVKSISSISKICIYDVNGKEINNFQINENNAINISNLSKGIYFIKIINNNEVLTERFMKE